MVFCVTSDAFAEDSWFFLSSTVCNLVWAIILLLDLLNTKIKMIFYEDEKSYWCKTCYFCIMGCLIKQPRLRWLRQCDLRWLGRVFQDQTLPSLSINYIYTSPLTDKFRNITTTAVLDKNENLFWSGLQWYRSFHSDEKTTLPILLAAEFLGTRSCPSKIVHGSVSLPIAVPVSVIEIFWDDVFQRSSTRALGEAS